MDAMAAHKWAVIVTVNETIVLEELREVSSKAHCASCKCFNINVGYPLL